MALWGNNDNVTSTGTVSLNYTTRVVTGAGTSFGLDGHAQVGDVIRFGVRGNGGVYYGDAVIVSIASTISCTIGSTSGLSGASIASTDFYVSELPLYTVGDYSYSNAVDANATLTNFGITGTATTNAGVGTDIIPVSVADLDVIVGDTMLNGGSDISISTIGNTTISLASTISAGISTGDSLVFKRYVDGYDKQVYGITTTTGYGSTTSAYRADGTGWVGITTYVDTHGNLRVKKEILVASSGITTGAGSILYPTNI